LPAAVRARYWLRSFEAASICSSRRRYETLTGSMSHLAMSEEAKKPLFWLAYYGGEEIGGVVVIESDSLIAARMNTLASRLDHGFTFAGGHALDAEQTA
jgi:hypothetical protein